MKVIVGLGNPGDKYIDTRHNTGFMFLDFLSEIFTKEGILVSWEFKQRFKAEVAEFKRGETKIALVKPFTYMNESGWSVSQYLSWNKVSSENMLLAHDDLDIPLGKFRISPDKSPKVHYGILSVEGYLKTKTFPRLRIGVDNRGGERNGMSGVSYVMGRFPEQEKQMLGGVFNDSLQEVFNFLGKSKKEGQKVQG